MGRTAIAGTAGLWRAACPRPAVLRRTLGTGTTALWWPLRAGTPLGRTLGMIAAMAGRTLRARTTGAAMTRGRTAGATMALPWLGGGGHGGQRHGAQ